MTIATASRNYSDNLRKLRRFLNGRGVNQRMTIVQGSVYANDRITVPGLHADDAICAVLNLTDLVDVAGYLEDTGSRAAVTIFSVNKGIVFTSLLPGTAGNNVYIKAEAAKDPITGAAQVSEPLRATIGAYDTVFRTTGHPGKTGILVSLATNASGVALTDGTNASTLVEAAINVAQEAMRGEAIVSMAQTGSGATDWTATGPTQMTGGTDFNQGPSAASLTDSNAFGSQHTGSVRYTARRRGTDGNSITITYVAGGALDVSVASTAITVTYVDQTTTAQEVVDAVNANADASALVLAALAPGASPDDVIDDDQGPDALSGGLDPGIELTVASNVKLLVAWFTRDQLDEN